VTASERTIDVNVDCGEDPAAAADGREARLLAWVSSANVACGAHAGDDATMRATVRAAVLRGVAVGAHPGYADRARFGREEVPMDLAVLEALVAAQVARLGRVAREEGVVLRHVKPHGALYHAASRRAEVAAAVGRAAAAWDRGLLLVGPAGSPALSTWEEMGLRARAEAFADRAYEADGSLRSRARPGALVAAPAAAAQRAVAIARGRGLVACDGSVLRLEARTIGLHGDTPHAEAIARAVRSALEAAGFALRA
jgi:UPF0271 protein